MWFRGVRIIFFRIPGRAAQDFLNGVCTHIIRLTKKKLTYYSGNYDTFQKSVKENEVIQAKKYAKEQDDIKHLKEFIASCGTYSNLVKQVPVLVLSFQIS